MLGCEYRFEAKMRDVTWLFNVSTAGVVRQVETRTVGRAVLCTSREGDSRWKVNQLLFADDTTRKRSLRERY